MSQVLLIILLILTVILTGLILIQRSEGGALGIGGGGGGGGGFMSGRGSANAVSRATGIIGTIFLALCLVLSITFNIDYREKSLLDAEEAEDGLINVDNSVKTDIPNADEIDAAPQSPVPSSESDEDTPQDKDEPDLP